MFARLILLAILCFIRYTYRVAYNYGLAEYKRQLDNKQKPKIADIKKQFNQAKKVLFPWMSETNKDANQQPFAYLQTAATLSNGEQWISSNPLRKKLQKLKFLQRRLSRKVKGSTNRRKQQIKIAKLHYEISCIRKDGLDKLTTHLCKNFKVICIENLNVRGMVKNHKLALSISDMGFGEFRRQLEYKSKLYGNDIVLVDRFFPSSKTCSFCGG